MSKFPSKRLLATLSPSDREFLFQMEYEDIKAEISGLVSGYTKPREDETKESRTRCSSPTPSEASEGRCRI